MRKYKQWKENQIPLQNDIKHMIGNPIFAIETNLMSLRRRILDGRTQEATEILDEIHASLEKIKTFLATQE